MSSLSPLARSLDAERQGSGTSELQPVTPASTTSGAVSPKTKIYIYLIFSEINPDGARVITSPRPPQELAQGFEANHPGWYVKRVWSVTCESVVTPTIAAIQSAYPGRTFV